MTKGKSATAWERVHALRAAGIPTTIRATGVGRSSETIAHDIYLSLPPRDKAFVDPWRDLGNSYFDSLMNSGVLSRTRTNPEARMSERGAREVFHGLPWQYKNVVRQWLATNGNDLPAAIANSHVLGSGPPITPTESRRNELQTMHFREVAEHESAHAVAAQALGYKVSSAYTENENSGYCTHAKASTKLEDAIIIIAPEIWLTRFRSSEFPYGPRGLQDDHRKLVEIGDEFVIRRAVKCCVELLKQNREIVLETADRIARGDFRPW